MNFWDVVLKFLAPVLGSLVGVLTPEIRNELVKLLKDLDAKAKATPNPFDDFVTGFLLHVFGIE